MVLCAVVWECCLTVAANSVLIVCDSSGSDVRVCRIEFTPHIQCVVSLRENKTCVCVCVCVCGGGGGGGGCVHLCVCMCVKERERERELCL